MLGTSTSKQAATPGRKCQGRSELMMEGKKEGGCGGVWAVRGAVVCSKVLCCAVLRVGWPLGDEVPEIGARVPSG
jgi:hypothetical protein